MELRVGQDKGGDGWGSVSLYLLLLGVAVMGWQPCHMSFTPEAWRETEPADRTRLAHSFVAGQLWRGATCAELEALLGPATVDAADRSWRLPVVWTGAAPATPPTVEARIDEPRLVLETGPWGVRLAIDHGLLEVPRTTLAGLYDPDDLPTGAFEEALRGSDLQALALLLDAASEELTVLT